MMRVLIVEDEKLSAERLEEQLLSVRPDFKVLARIGSVRETVEWLKNNTADLVFLDIRLSDGLSFSIFDQVTIHTPVIFTTAFDQYAIKAFKVNSIAYLLKPIRTAELIESLNKYETLKSAFSIDFDRLMAGIQGKTAGYKNRFLIQIGDKFKKVETINIAYFYALDKGVYLKTNDDHSYPVEETLDGLEELVDPALFFRINRKYIINMNAISSMVAWSRSRIKLTLNPKAVENDDTTVSIDRSPNFRKWLNQ